MRTRGVPAPHARVFTHERQKVHTCNATEGANSKEDCKESKEVEWAWVDSWLNNDVLLKKIKNRVTFKHTQRKSVYVNRQCFYKTRYWNGGQTEWRSLYKMDVSAGISLVSFKGPNKSIKSAVVFSWFPVSFCNIRKAKVQQNMLHI